MKVEASHEGSTYNKPYLGWAIAGRAKGGKAYIGVPTQLTGKTAEEVAALEGIDTVAGATCSSNAILKAVQDALKNPAA